MKQKIIMMLSLTLLLMILTSCTQPQLVEQPRSIAPTTQKIGTEKRTQLAINETELQNLEEGWRIDSCYDADGADALTPTITELSTSKLDKSGKNLAGANVYSIPDKCINSNTVSEVVCSRIAGEQRKNKLRFVSGRPPELPIKINIMCPEGTRCLMQTVPSLLILDEDEQAEAAKAGACVREQIKPIPLPPMARIYD